MRKFAALLWVVALQAVAACSTVSNADSENTLQATECPSHNISGEVYCRFLLVAENPDVPLGRRIPIRIMVLRATGAAPDPDPLLIIPGGPGQSAIEAPNLRTFFSSYFAPIRVHRDLILVDQRGVGGSNPLPLDPAPELLYARTDMNLAPEWGRAALPRLEEQADLTQYTTARAVDDLDAVRRALQVEKINLYATSYGTRVAQHYIKRYGSKVRSAILKGVSPPDDNIALSYGREPQRALDLLFQLCTNDAACSEANPDLRGQLRRVLEGLSAMPVDVETRHPMTDEPTSFRITRGSFAFGIRSQMMSAHGFARLPKLISQANAGDFSAWADFLPRLPALYATQLYGGMTFSVIAAEDVPRLTEAAIHADTADTLIGDVLARGFAEIGELWPNGEAPADLFTRLETEVPILLVSGALDPATPPDGADAMLPGLVNGRHIVFPGGAHSSANFNGLDQIMTQFIAEGSAGNLDLSAVAKNRPPPFFAGTEEIGR